MKSSKRWLSLLLAFVMLFTSFDSAVLAAGAALAPKAQTTELKGVVKGKKEIFNFTVPQTGKKTAVKSRVRRESGFFRAGAPVKAPANSDTVITVNTKGLGSNPFDWSALPNGEFKITAKWETSDGQEHFLKDFATITENGAREFTVGWPTDGTMVRNAAIEVQYDQDINVRVLFTPETSEGQLGKLSFKIDLTELANSMVDVKYVDPYGKALAAENMPAQGSTMPNITSDNLTGVAMPLPAKSETVNMRESEDIDEAKLHAAADGVAYKVGDKGNGDKVTIDNKEYTLSISDPNPKENATISLRYEPDVLVPDRDNGEYPPVPNGYKRLTFNANQPQEGQTAAVNGRFNNLGEKIKVIDVKDGVQYDNEKLKEEIAKLKPVALNTKDTPDEKKVFDKWNPAVPTDGTAVDTKTYNATYTDKYSNKDVIPYVPADPKKPTNPDDTNVPTTDKDGKTVDKTQYDIVAFKVADADKTKGSLTLGDKVEQQVISALVKKGSKWEKVTAPTINVADAKTTKANGYNPAIPAGTETVENGKVYTAQFITNGQEITPGTELPDGVFEVSVSRDETSVKTDPLYGKSYAVFKDSKLAKDKFPTPQAEENFKDAKWNVENPWDQAITKKTDFKASAISSVFDKQNITKIEVIQDPTTMTYTEGDKPKHDGIKVKLTDKKGNTVEIEKDKLGEYGVTVTPAEDKGLTVKDNNGKPFVASVNDKDGKPLTADSKTKITVNPKKSDQSATPSINQPTEGDNAITGKGAPDAKVVVTDNNGKEIGKTTVGPDGKWSVPVPADRPLKKGDVITATQTENGKKPASAEATVKGKDSGGIIGGTLLIPTIPTTPSVEKPKHETAIHKAYIFGYEDSTFRPEGNMTRAEAAAMLARLQGLDLSNSARPNFVDVRSGWYNAVINAVVNAGYMKGYPDGTFRPDGKITRAEFTQMIKAIDKANTGMAPFADVKGHWAEAAINQAYANARIKGYPDGTFRPNNHITRAEAVTVFNKLYDRSVGLTGLRDVLTGIVPFNDVNVSHWAYYDIIEASNTHTFYRTEKGQVPETWVMLNQTWKQALENR